MKKTGIIFIVLLLSACVATAPQMSMATVILDRSTWPRYSVRGGRLKIATVSMPTVMVMVTSTPNKEARLNRSINLRKWIIIRSCGSRIFVAVKIVELYVYSH